MLNCPDWQSVDEFEEWWCENVIAFNRLAVSDPKEWHRVAAKVEAFQWRRLRETVKPR